ncbi:MAG: hypothetical protein ACAI38_15405 [Myxococcota bacterium]|nr:hypothetical protein [Myxococcota bacterium]
MKAIVATCCLLVAGVAGVAVAGDKMDSKAKDMKSCGQHMADRAVLPTKMVELMTSVADMMDAHAAFMVATAKGNKDAIAEADGMKMLAKDHRDLATMMGKTATNMTNAAKWPNAPHDEKMMMSDPKIMESMKRLLKTEKEMAALMQQDIAMMEAHAPKSTN